MKTIRYPFILVWLTMFSCHHSIDENFHFGKKYNAVRRKFGAPIIKNNMNPVNCCHEWTVYLINEKFIKNEAFHRSKTIRSFKGKKLQNEEDIFMNKVGKNTYQLNVLTVYNWNEHKLIVDGNVGDINKAEWQTLKNENEIDSVLRSWGLSRFDN